MYPSVIRNPLSQTRVLTLLKIWKYEDIWSIHTWKKIWNTLFIFQSIVNLWSQYKIHSDLCIRVLKVAIKCTYIYKKGKEKYIKNLKKKNFSALIIIWTFHKIWISNGTSKNEMLFEFPKSVQFKAINALTKIEGLFSRFYNT